jgi:hypothetical protein
MHPFSDLQPDKKFTNPIVERLTMIDDRPKADTTNSHFFSNLGKSLLSSLETRCDAVKSSDQAVSGGQLIHNLLRSSNSGAELPFH